jgi:quinoprotein glucose dehydrogenase
MGQLSGLRDRDPAAAGRAQAEGVGNRVHPDAPYDSVPGGGRFKFQNMYCQQPPWGQLSAVDVNTGEFVWRVTLGVTDSLPPDKQNTGRPGNGGSIATAGGLVFIAATDDARFRAFDAKSVQARRRRQRHAEHVSWQGWPAVRGDRLDGRRVLRGAADRRQHRGVCAPG